MINNSPIYAQWMQAKLEEQEAQTRRRLLEDQMVKDFKISDALEGVENFEIHNFKIKITGRINRKVDGDKIQAIATEHGLSEHLPNLFNWKPSIIMAVWKNTDAAITLPLLDGITTTPSRPSFAITEE